MTGVQTCALPIFRELIPEKDVEIRATMEVVERERKRLKTGIVIRVEKTGQTQWFTTYEAKRDGKVAEQWRVCHELGQANRYEQSGRLAKRAEIHSSLAGSSFSIADFGMRSEGRRVGKGGRSRGSPYH